MELQSRNANFKTEVRSKSADPQLSMHWIKEFEFSKSIDELLTSRSITRRTDFSDYDLLDAMIASALKKLLINCVHFRKKASVEEQRARFVRGLFSAKVPNSSFAEGRREIKHTGA